MHTMGGLLIALSYNGSITDFDPVGVGSTPTSAACNRPKWKKQHYFSKLIVETSENVEKRPAFFIQNSSGGT